MNKLFLALVLILFSYPALADPWYFVTDKGCMTMEEMDTYWQTGNLQTLDDVVRFFEPQGKVRIQETVGIVSVYVDDELVGIITDGINRCRMFLHTVANRDEEDTRQQLPVTVEVTRTTWVLSYNGWYPYVEIQIQNDTNQPLDRISLKVFMLDDKNVEQYDSSNYISELFPGRTKEISFQSHVGHRNDLPFMKMLKSESSKWRYEVFLQIGYDNEWHQVADGLVDVPYEYKNMFGN